MRVLPPLPPVLHHPGPGQRPAPGLQRPQLHACTPCPQGQVTQGPNSQTLSQCFQNCSSGQEVGEATNVCRDCDLEWSVSSCSPGRYFDAVATQCTDCPASSYQPAAGSTQCLACPDFQVTLQPAATSLADCQTRCQVGANARCVDDASDGSTSCVCNSRYQGNGTECTHLCDLTSPQRSQLQSQSYTGTPICTCSGPYSGARCETRAGECHLVLQYNRIYNVLLSGYRRENKHAISIFATYFHKFSVIKNHPQFSGLCCIGCQSYLYLYMC